jgi:hypothetical protein
MTGQNNEPVIETWAREEYRDGVSAGAAARQLCRSLGAHGGYPTTRRMLDDLLREANEMAFEIASLKEALRDQN